MSFLASSACVPRDLNITLAQAGALLGKVAAAQKAEALAWRRLAALFPMLARRLVAALKQTRAHRRNADLACRHYLCAEALAEVKAHEAASRFVGDWNVTVTKGRPTRR